MSEPTDNPRPFDVGTIRYLINLMSRHDLSEIDLTEGDRRIRLRRGGTVVTSIAAPVAPLAGPAPVAAGSVPTAQAEKPETKGPPLLEIKSPAVGTFYAQQQEGAAPFVTVGSRITPTTVVCLVEAMKVFNEVPAECSGTIAEICVKNKDFVEYGTVLFRVAPN